MRHAVSLRFLRYAAFRYDAAALLSMMRFSPRHCLPPCRRRRRRYAHAY